MDTKDRIKSARILKGYTQEELGQLVGVQKAAIQKYENGSVENLKRSMIKKLSDALDVSPSYLMGWDDDPSPKSATAELSDILADLPKSELKRISDFMEVAGDLTDEQFEKVMAFVRFIKTDVKKNGGTK
jgi:transcriptional regulator with XRE-family HTH domain